MYATYPQDGLPRNVQEIMRELTAVKTDYQQIIKLGIAVLEIGGLDAATTAYVKVVLGVAYRGVGDRLRAQNNLLEGQKLTLALPVNERDTLLLIEAAYTLALTLASMGNDAAARATMAALREQLSWYAWPEELPSALLALNRRQETLELHITLRRAI